MREASPGPRGVPGNGLLSPAPGGPPKHSGQNLLCLRSEKDLSRWVLEFHIWISLYFISYFIFFWRGMGMGITLGPNKQALDCSCLKAK